MQANVGDVLGVNERKFVVLKFLGKGKGGYSYLVCSEDGCRYTLKQIHHEPCSYYTFGDKMQAELSDYRRLQSIGIPLPQLVEADVRQERLLKEYVEGPTAMELVLRGEMRPEYIAQVEAMCAKLYAANTNIDYFPTNFIVCDNRLIYIDYECNDYMEQWDFAHWGILYWSQTPELLRYASEHDLAVLKLEHD